MPSSKSERLSHALAQDHIAVAGVQSNRVGIRFGHPIRVDAQMRFRLLFPLFHCRCLYEEFQKFWLHDGLFHTAARQFAVVGVNLEADKPTPHPFSNDSGCARTDKRV
jgi:hypothetical protein